MRSRRQPASCDAETAGSVGVWHYNLLGRETTMSETLRSKGIFRSRVIGLLLVLAICSWSAFGQSATGNISGTVTDASGAVIPKATVLLTDEATGSKRQTISNTAGVFNFAAVLPASYTVNISAAGFRAWEERQIVMTQGSNLNIPNIGLEVG